MFTYLLMGLPFIAAVLALDLLILKTRVVLSRQCWIVMAIMLALTLVFDQVLTGLPIVNYNENNMTGIRIWHVPAEDLLYTFAAVVGLGSMRKYFEQR